MNSKVLLFLAMLLAAILLISAEAASKDNDEKFNKNDDNMETNGVADESKYGYGWGWGYGGPWRGGYGGPWHHHHGRHGHHHGGWRRGHGRGYYCLYGCCSRWSYYGGCRCCFPGEHQKVNTNVEPSN
ncbi:hypothetical protein P8452_01153 [Trifolium repens]|nr:hypothetical protein P8452_01153 [Trifolium repens]